MSLTRRVFTFAGTFLAGAGWIGGKLFGGHHCTWLSPGYGEPPKTIPPKDQTSARWAHMSIELRNKDTSDRLETTAVMLPGTEPDKVIADLLLSARYYVHAYPVLMPPNTPEQVEAPRYQEVIISLHLAFEALPTKHLPTTKVCDRVISVRQSQVTHAEVWEMAKASTSFFVDALREITHRFPHWG